jgi:hypothetical protein
MPYLMKLTHNTCRGTQARILCAQGAAVVAAPPPAMTLIYLRSAVRGATGTHITGHGLQLGDAPAARLRCARSVLAWPILTESLGTCRLLLTRECGESYSTTVLCVACKYTHIAECDVTCCSRQADSDRQARTLAASESLRSQISRPLSPRPLTQLELAARGVYQSQAQYGSMLPARSRSPARPLYSGCAGLSCVILYILACRLTNWLSAVPGYLLSAGRPLRYMVVAEPSRQFQFGLLRQVLFRRHHGHQDQSCSIQPKLPSFGNIALPGRKHCIPSTVYRRRTHSWWWSGARISKCTP